MAQLALACGAAKQAKNSRSAIFMFLQRAKIVIPNHFSLPPGSIRLKDRGERHGYSYGKPHRFSLDGCGCPLVPVF